jgi:hypothetical protein
MLFKSATSALAVIAMLAFVGAAPAPASAASQQTGKQTGAHSKAHGKVHGKQAGAQRAKGRSARAKSPRARLTTLGNSSGFVALVGDKSSGYGFYPLPWHYRVGAWRWRQQRAARSAEALGVAVASTAVYSYGYGFPGGYGYGLSNHHGVFNPVDGYGSPFFAGYYGPAGDSGGDPGPFGRPYGN